MGLQMKSPSRDMTLQEASTYLMKEESEAETLLRSRPFTYGSIRQIDIGVTVNGVSMTLMEAANKFSDQKMRPFIVWSD